jgi:hypothetical protein
MTPTVGSEGSLDKQREQTISIWAIDPAEDLKTYSKNLIPVPFVNVACTSPVGRTFSGSLAANFCVTSFLIDAM